jgi:hypothetical protein
MAINQRDIVEVPFNLPQGIRVHPAIVLSTNDAIVQEGCFIALMMTTDQTTDEYSFELKDTMLSKNLPVRFCQARVHLISLFNQTEAIPNRHYNTRIKEKFFYQIIDAVMEKAFGA